jgi:hypothetical protein
LALIGEVQEIVVPMNWRKDSLIGMKLHLAYFLAFPDKN